jgi:transcriptional regulator with XRE-family HTH domain
VSIVANIKLLCDRHETSIPKLEKELGFGRGTIYKWDANDPGVDKVQRVARRFGVSVDFLLSGRERCDSFTPETIIKIAKKNRVSIGDAITVLDEAKAIVLSESLVEMEEVNK